MNVDSRYQIIEKAGSGGMATVYRARDTVLNRDVAIKVLHPHLVEKEEIKKRFLREAQAIARLRHKNIIEIYDYHSDDKDCYIISEFIRGKSLAALLSEYDISSPFIAAMIVSVLSDAVSHAHNNNVIHRDLKPENILISENYQLKITDFGIAHITDAESLTITGSISGSPAHMSPEQIDGKNVDIRTDIFSLGTILYLLSSGELPFKGNSPASIFKSILMGEFREPKELNPVIDNKFSAIIHKCLRKNISERYRNCIELKSELTDYLRGYGLTDIEQNLQEFFRNPLEYPEELNKKIVRHLKNFLYNRIQDRENRLEIQNYLNVLLHLAPDDTDSKALFERFSSLEESEKRSARIKYGIAVIIILSFIFSLIYWKISFSDKEELSDSTESTDITVIQQISKPSDDSRVPSDEINEKAAQGDLPEVVNKGTEDAEMKKTKRKTVHLSGKEISRHSENIDSQAAVRYGELNLFIKPYGDIYINNNLAGREKATLSVKLKSGRHLIRVKNPFFFDIEKEVSIEPETKTDLRLVFDSVKPAKLFINSQQECDIYIDGNFLGRSDMYTKTGITIPINSKDGKREILLKASKYGYKDFIKKIEFTAGETKTVKINLTREK
ncbi:MAG: protein kinase [Deltaproteobacteria bacterium]|nr:protein kinase [Deltaproteobacteria bacterium]